MEKEKDFIVTNDDKKAVEERLRSFVLPQREEPEVYQPVIFTETPKETNYYKVLPKEEDFREEIKEKTKDIVIISKESLIYYDSKGKKILDFLFGFIAVLIMFYFLNFQPLLIFLIYFLGMVQAVWAFKVKRLFVVWGFISGATFSMFLSLLVYFTL